MLFSRVQDILRAQVDNSRHKQNRIFRHKRLNALKKSYNNIRDYVCADNVIHARNLIRKVADKVFRFFRNAVFRGVFTCGFYRLRVYIDADRVFRSEQNSCDTEYSAAAAYIEHSVPPADVFLQKL